MGYSRIRFGFAPQQILILLSVLLLGIYSCRKDFYASPTEKSTQLLENWYKLQVNEKTQDTLFNSLKPDWRQTKHYEFKGMQVMEVALENANNLVSKANNDPTKPEQLTAQTYTKLLLLRENNGTNFGGYMMLNGKAKVALSDLQYNNFEDFSGTINYYNLHSQFTNGYVLEQGKIIKTIKPYYENLAAKKNRTTKSTMMAKSIDCDILTFDIYKKVCFEAGPVSPAEYLNTMSPTCTTIVIGSYDIMMCDDGGGGGDSYPSYEPKGGGATGNTESTDPKDDDCAKAIKLKAMAGAQQVATTDKKLLDNLKSTDSLVSKVEYGAEINLKKANLTDGYMESKVRTDNGTSSFSPKFTWNDTSGRTIGANHSHPGKTCPSPSDVVWMHSNLRNPELLAAGEAGKKLYKENAFVAVQTTDAKYIVTISDWNAFSKFSPTDSLNREFKKQAEDYIKNGKDISFGEATVYALKNIFGDSINIFKANAESTEYKPQIIDKTTKKTINKAC